MKHKKCGGRYVLHRKGETSTLYKCTRCPATFVSYKGGKKP